MTDCGLVWIKINGHIRQNLYFLKNATEDGLKIAWTLDTFTVSIANARRQTKEGNTAGAADSLKEALEVFKSLLLPIDAGSQGGLK